MWFSSAFYFFAYGAISFLFPFLALFYRGLGLSGSQIGVLVSLAPLVSMISGPFWTGTADATRRHKLILVISITGAISVVLVLARLTAFLWLIPFICLYAFISAPIFSLVDSATMALLGERRDRYGRVRLWGTIGWGLLAPVAGQLIQRLGIQWAFWGYAAMMSLVLVVALVMPFRQGHAAGSFRSGMRTLLANRHWMFFLAMVFICGIGMSTVNNYLALYMQGIGAGETLMGVALTISTFSELPVMFFGNRLLKRYGARGMLVLAMVVVGVRLLLYSIAGEPWMVLCIQLVHGLTFPLIYIAGVSYADQNAPAGVKATAQGMFGSALMGFGAAAGGLLGGTLFQAVGAALMYRIVGFVVLAALILFLLVEHRSKTMNNEV